MLHTSKQRSTSKRGNVIAFPLELVQNKREYVKDILEDSCEVSMHVGNSNVTSMCSYIHNIPSISHVNELYNYV